ncbi:hypothetical protein Axy18_021 [Achromobacter phage vB_AxyS_19-32_Axy18]|nr:hypothetical protein Axy18_021 [Achromobacter phage vB_AxyS_19-32_Axy18]
MTNISAYLGLISIGLFVVWFGLGMFAVFYEDCVTHGPGKWHSYILAPVGVFAMLLGILIIYHATRVFIL